MLKESVHVFSCIQLGIHFEKEPSVGVKESW